ncbi:MAG: hypothetical protein ACXAEU_21675 [Candidatus Hodarchaeales archaeon]
MDSTSMINLYCRKVGVWLLSLIPIFLAIVLIFIAVSPEDIVLVDPRLLLATVTYITLMFTAIPFAINGFLMERDFNAEIKRIESTGLLIQGVEGFHDIESSIKLLYRGSYSITGTVIISFLVFISAIALQTTDIGIITRIFIFTASIGLLAISSGASILLRLPDKSALQPGGLMRFYTPKSISLRLDNVLTDSIFTHLDPITRIRMDEWSKSIQEHFNPIYLSNSDDQAKLERAREKIFLMIYLKEFIPELMTNEIFQREIEEIINPDYIAEFLKGHYSGISKKTLVTVIRDIKDEIPQIFEIIQRIFVLVTDNLQYLRTKEEFVTICHPTSHIGNINPFRITVFVLNMKNVQRKINIESQTSMTSLDPDNASQMLLLDEGNLTLPQKGSVLKFSSTTEPVDVLRLVSAILQIGDTLSLQFRPNRFGTHVLNISVEDPERGIITGRSVVVEVKRDLRYYAKTVGAKALGYAGAAVSLIGISMGSIISLLQI